MMTGKILNYCLGDFSRLRLPSRVARFSLKERNALRADVPECASGCRDAPRSATTWILSPQPASTRVKAWTVSMTMEGYDGDSEGDDYCNHEDRGMRSQLQP